MSRSRLREGYADRDARPFDVALFVRSGEVPFIGRLDGQAALVTCGTSGIAREVVSRFVEEGACVGVMARMTDRTDALRLHFGAPVVATPGDASEFADNKRAVAETANAFSHLDVFVGNSGVFDVCTRFADLAEGDCRIFRRRTGCTTLDRLPAWLHANAAELLMVLDGPETPLHMNGSENDTRCQVTRRKVSAGTRSDIGRDCRGAFLSLAKTCGKHGIALWNYLDRRLKVEENTIVEPLDHYVSARNCSVDKRRRPHFCPCYNEHG